jgi:hypothetical protein
MVKVALSTVTGGVTSVLAQPEKSRPATLGEGATSTVVP